MGKVAPGAQSTTTPLLHHQQNHQHRRHHQLKLTVAANNGKCQIKNRQIVAYMVTVYDKTGKATNEVRKILLYLKQLIR